VRRGDTPVVEKAGGGQIVEKRTDRGLVVATVDELRAELVSRVVAARQ